MRRKPRERERLLRTKPAEDRADARKQPRVSETLMVHAELTHRQRAAVALMAGVDEGIDAE